MICIWLYYVRSNPHNLFVGCVENSLRLAGGQTELEGTIEVCANGIWGLVGDAGWSDADADVACRQLGLPTGGTTA